MGIWGVVRGWVYRGSMVGEICGVEQSGSGSSVGCQGVGRLCGVQRGWVPGEEKALDIGPGRGGAGDLSRVKLTVSLGISPGGGRRRGAIGKKLICTIISQKDKASVHVGRGKLPTGSSLDKHREEEGGFDTSAEGFTVSHTALGQARGKTKGGSQGAGGLRGKDLSDPFVALQCWFYLYEISFPCL